MKKQIFSSIVILLFLSAALNAQNYTVSITSSGNVAGSPVSYNETAIRISFTWSGQKVDPSYVWKFKLSFGYPPGVLQKSGQIEESWTDENAPFFDVVGYTLLQHVCVIQMYEFTPSGINLGQRALNSTSVIPMQTVYVGSNFGGTISVNGATVASGASFNLGSGQSLNLSAIESQSDSQGYTMMWGSASQWKVNNQGFSSSKSTSYSANGSQNGATITAELKRVCSITFNGPVLSGGTYYYFNPVIVLEGNAVEVTALGRTSSDFIDQAFSSWSDNNTQNPRSFVVNSNTSFGINYVGVKANNGYKNLQFVGSTGQNVQLQWSEHPNSAVNQYQIWRRVKHNGVTGPETQIGTVGRGVCSFTDYDYVYTSSYSNDLLWYDVRAYYSTAGTYADAEWNAAFGRVDYMKDNNSNSAAEISNELPTKFEFSNYPNPFNPTTTISYQLPEKSFVTIKVFDILGKEIATLVNENKPAGYHTVNFSAVSGSASGGDGSKLTSGVYIYTIQVNGITQSKKMLLAK